jgi:hypothetical protein
MLELVTKRYIAFHFLSGVSVVCYMGFLCRQKWSSPFRFQVSSAVIIFLFLFLYILDPVIFNYVNKKNYLISISESLSRNAHFALFPYFFFMSNLIRSKKLKRLDLKRVFNLIFLCILFSMCYRNSLTREFVQRIPIFKDIIPPSTSVVTLFLPGIIAISKIRKYEKIR